MKSKTPKIEICVDRLHEHYTKLLNRVNDDSHSVLDVEGIEFDDAFFTAAEVEGGVKLLKNYKSAGNSFITGELVKALADTPPFIDFLTFMFNHVCHCGLPSSWNSLKLTSLYKNKGDKQTAANYRGLCIMDTIPKLYALLLN